MAGNTEKIIKKYIDGVGSADNKAKSRAKEYDDALIKPPRSMGKLEDIRTDLEEYGEEAPGQIRKSAGKAFIICLALIIIIALWVIVSLWMSSEARKSKTQKEKEEFLKNQGITTGMLEVTTYDM